MTTFKNIIDRAYGTSIGDYRLDMLIKKDPDIFYEWMAGFVENSIDMFDGCLESLSYHIDEKTIEKDGKLVTVKEYIFDKDLNSKQQYILMLGVVLGWYRKDLDDVITYKAKLSSKDFKELANASHLKTRQDRLGAMEETLSEAITSYQINNIEKLPYFGG